MIAEYITSAGHSLISSASEIRRHGRVIHKHSSINGTHKVHTIVPAAAKRKKQLNRSPNASSAV